MPVWRSPLFLVGITLALVLALALLFSDFIWDEFIFRYFWGPVEADARDKDYEGISEGYNPINTISYGLIVALSVYGIFKYFEQIKLAVDTPFILAILPFMILGSVTRSLEDAELFDIPLTYIFISPLIYIILGILVLLLVFFFDHVTRWVLKELKAEDGKKQRYVKIVAAGSLSVVPALILTVYAILSTMNSAVLASYPDLVAVIFLTIAFSLAAMWLLDRLEFSVALGVGWAGLYLLSFFFLFVIQFLWFDTWYDSGGEVKLWVIPGIVVLTILVTGLACLPGWWLERKKPVAVKRDTGPGFLEDLRLTFVSFLQPLNVAVLFAHFLDASATFVGIDFFGYTEKHVLPAALIEFTGTAAVMFPLKLLIVAFIIYLIDIYYKEDLEEAGYGNMAGLLKLSIIVLGLAPGMRDMIRLAMGV